MAVFCFDGTSEFKHGHHGGTNVLRLADIIDAPSHYFGGVGNAHENNTIETPIGLAFGYGGLEIVSKAMKRFIASYPDDRIVDIIGFSRGSALAIAFMHRARSWAIEHGYADMAFRFVGLMDTVFTFGLPNDIDLHYYHDIPDDVPIKAFYHAIALHETRSWFAVHFQQRQANVDIFEQRAFKGAHADIGGGYRQRELSNIVLNWLIEGAQKAGVPFTNQLPQGSPYSEAAQTQVPVSWEYYKSDPNRLPRRENQWYWPQAPRPIPRPIVEEAMSRGLSVDDWQRRIVKDYRLRPHPRIFNYLVNLSPYVNHNGKVVDPRLEYTTYVKKRANGKLIKTAEHIPLTLDQRISYKEEGPVHPLHQPRRHRHPRRP